MARKTAAKLNLLTVREAQTAGEGDHTDGGGLLLRVRGESASWVLRYTAPTGRRREMGLGVARRNNAAATGDNLTTARRLAHEARTSAVDDEAGNPAPAAALSVSWKPGFTCPPRCENVGAFTDGKIFR